MVNTLERGKMVLKIISDASSGIRQYLFSEKLYENDGSAEPRTLFENVYRGEIRGALRTQTVVSRDSKRTYTTVVKTFTERGAIFLDNEQAPR